MQTVRIDIINNKALQLLKDLELLKLIRMHKDEPEKTHSGVNWSAKYKGAMTKQSREDVDNQLKDLRNEWE